MNEELIVKMKFGSHLYGTANENSDTDYKGIFMPSKEQILLQRVPHSINTKTKTGNMKNNSDDIDTEIYSLNYFIHLACEGETVAIDMLHAPDSMILATSNLWQRIVSQRYAFYTSNLKSFVGYARRQASKYGIKGSRLNDAKRVLDFLEPHLGVVYGNDYGRLKSFWDDLPEGEHIFKHLPDINGVRMYEVCGRKIPETATLEYAYDIVNKFHKAYGERAKQAANNEGIDWKAVSHAIRAAYQVKEILQDRTVTFPLKNAAFIRDIKEGKLDYQSVVAPMLDSLMDEVEELSLKSDLPKSVDRGYWDRFLIHELSKSLRLPKEIC